MSTMFSGGGGSSAASVGQGNAPANSSGNNPGNNASPSNQGGGDKAGGGGGQQGGGTPFFKETIKVGGKDVEVSFGSKEELIAEIQKARASHEQFKGAAKQRAEAEALREEAHKARQEAEQLRAKYGDNHLQASIDAAIRSGDPNRIKAAREVMENQLADLIRRDMMDPKERALEEERAKREAAENQVKEYKTKEEQAAHQQKVEGFKQEFTNTIIKALETGECPNSEWTAGIMANLIRLNRQKGLKLTPEALAEKTKAVMINQVTGLFAKTTGEQLIQLFPDVVKKIRAADLARIKGRRPQQGGGKPPEGPTHQEDKKPAGNGYMSPDQWREWTKKRAAAAQAGRPLPD